MAEPTPERETIAALAAQVADLRGKVTAATAWQDRNAGLSGLPNRVAELAKALEDALADDGAIRPLAPYFLDLSEEEYDGELSALRQWVSRVLRPNYPGYVETDLRPCWWRHQEAIWELATLRAEWRRIYERRKPELAGALAWHDRYLPGVLARLSRVMSNCNDAMCRLDRQTGDQ